LAVFDFLPEIIPGDPVTNGILWGSFLWIFIVLIIVIVWIVTSKRKAGTDVSALAALASSEPTAPDATANADPKEVMTILSIERVAASTALTAVKDARRSKRISSRVADTLSGRYKARIAKIEDDLKRRTSAQEYQSLAQSLEQTRDRLRGQVTTTPPPPPQSGTPGIPPTAPPVPGSRPPTGPPKRGVPSIPAVPTAGPPSSGVPPTKPASPIPTPPKIPTVGPPTSKPTTVVPPSVAPPTISTPPLPPKLPSTPSVAPPTTSDLAPPPVPTSAPSAAPTAPATGDGDPNTISGLRMEMLRELARLKKFMSEETQ
jgi:hypothetical protein